MNIEIIPIKALTDNYIWAICNLDSKQCICVDPGESPAVVAFLQQNSLTLDAIFVTHHHWDHTHGIAGLIQHYHVPVYGPSQENLAHCDFPLSDTELVSRDMLGDMKFEILYIPGHTLGHIAFYAPGILFCGDTLFSSGCGRVFEGTMEQMYHSLQRLANLPDDTQVYCGHEYTLHNLRFAQLVEPDNLQIAQRLELVEKMRANDKCTVPSSIAVEKSCNPFLRTDQATVMRTVAAHSGKKISRPVEIFANLRHWKDNF
jgi:hydroxyacylglutathione hydrolase